jgi:signal peptidase I
MKFLETRKGVVIVTTPILLVVVVWVLFGVSITRASGNSNLPTIKDNDLQIVTRAFSYQRGEFILFRFDGRGYPALYIKRIVGLPGDQILMVRGKLSINGQPLEEKEIINHWKQRDSFDDCSYLANSDYWNFVSENPLRPESPCLENLSNAVKTSVSPNYKPTPYVVPENSYFVIGDNRSPGGSEDSRAFGAVTEGQIRGVLRFVGFLPRALEIPESYRINRK